MRNKAIFFIVFLFAFSIKITAQWPGNFYAFVLKDSAGKIINTNNTDYKLTVIGDSTGEAILDIKICSDNKTWRFYEGGNHYMGSTQKLEIVRTVNGKAYEKMIIEFSPSISQGKDQYYRNLYAGVLKFKKGIFKIKLPQTGEQWDNLNEMKLCEDGINFTSYYDVSKFQK